MGTKKPPAGERVAEGRLDLLGGVMGKRDHPDSNVGGHVLSQRVSPGGGNRAKPLETGITFLPDRGGNGCRPASPVGLNGFPSG
jgi:hypothetical protein